MQYFTRINSRQHYIFHNIHKKNLIQFFPQCTLINIDIDEVKYANCNQLSKMIVFCTQSCEKQIKNDVFEKNNRCIVKLKTTVVLLFNLNRSNLLDSQFLFRFDLHSYYLPVELKTTIREQCACVCVSMTVM